MCWVSLSRAVAQANPSIENINYIYPGDCVVCPGMCTQQQLLQMVANMQRDRCCPANEGACQCRQRRCCTSCCTSTAKWQDPYACISKWQPCSEQQPCSTQLSRSYHHCVRHCWRCHHSSSGICYVVYLLHDAKVGSIAPVPLLMAWPVSSKPECGCSHCDYDSLCCCRQPKLHSNMAPGEPRAAPAVKASSVWASVCACMRTVLRAFGRKLSCMCPAADDGQERPAAPAGKSNG